MLSFYLDHTIFEGIHTPKSRDFTRCLISTITFNFPEIFEKYQCYEDMYNQRSNDLKGRFKSVCKLDIYVDTIQISVFTELYNVQLAKAIWHDIAVMKRLISINDIYYETGHQFFVKGEKNEESLWLPRDTIQTIILYRRVKLVQVCNVNWS